MAGSRPGALIAACWASMMNMGEAGYIESCSEIVGTTKKLISSIQSNPALCSDLQVIGNPTVSVVAFTSKSLNIYAIADAMREKGWHLNSLQSPPAVHIAMTLPTCKVWEKFVGDLESVVEDEQEKDRVRIVEGKGAKNMPTGDSAALYGVAGSLPNKGVVVELATGFLDTLYKA